MVLDVVFGLVASAIGSLRWLRVAQREHYLAGSTARFASRWWRTQPLNLAALLVAVAGISAAAFWPPSGIATVLVGLTAPVGLSIRGRTSALAWTPRLRRVALALFVIDGVVLGAVAVGAGLRVSGVVALSLVIVGPVLIDGVLVVLAPLEQRLALRYVNQAQAVLGRVRPRVIAITGSFGKTSTKGYVAHLLAGHFSVLASPRSFNNRAGLARTVNDLLLPGTEVLIAEMGTYGAGEIAEMVAWMPPEVAVLTAIGPVHLERFRTLDAIVRAKREIVVGAAVVVLNDDDPLLSALADELEGSGQRVIRCSSSDSHSQVAVVASGDDVVISVGGEQLGRVNLGETRASIALSNVACALGVALAMGLRVDDLLPALQTLPVAENRLTSVVGGSGVLILDDTYNSNPSGTALALDALARAASPGHKVVVVSPGMVELGPVQEAENANFGAAVAKMATQFVIVGRTNRTPLLAGVRTASLDGARCEIRLVDNRTAAVEIVQSDLGSGDVVLYENDLPDHYA